MTVVGELFENPLAELTPKQREVLDLLIQHKTSKEISRLLGISHHTVDQRIMLARAKLGVATRGEVAQAYRRLIELYEQPVYEFSHVGFPPLPGAPTLQEETDETPSTAAFAPAALDMSGGRQPGTQPSATGTHEAAFAPAATRVSMPGFAKAPAPDDIAYYRVLPEMFDGPNGTLWRLGFIGGLTVFMILIVLGGLSMFAQLSSLLDR
ncbi:MAG: helix-turn-helix transcriptional regulator [Novosphingobium sp. 28-62-57]|uniref:helix-turn-helix domain-containing protein n=1 Tax=unclassified Novosphingobium TaxID=2644732 RepID=UPI000BC80DAA|nr:MULTISPECIES: helix-turn-helix transcriptional regulator [unclassified Novosphingobium]OYW47775.1 MAG: helix-turn-helix transcriptional regulator [Novosphingobium sp. 12-62-10]OYZ09048.1 MAG: helix-turn-helix transcriptional regulator [Novosphingobium sp. 28-62-57]OZA35757.1 MAG: helix-turn-helix transcriptional regulator [Novosphingobium sp. 17-62-9]